MDVPRMLYRCAGVLGLVTALNAGAAESGYETLALPGFSIEVPKGQVLKNTGTPQAGAYEIAYLPANRRDKRLPPEESPFILNVSWIAARMARADWINYVAPGIDSAGTFSGTELTGQREIGKDRWLAVRRQPAMELDRPYTAIGLVECNARFAVTVRFSFYEDAAAQAAATERIVKSVKCDPATAQLSSPEAALALPPAFKRVQGPLQHYKAADGRSVKVAVLPQDTVSNIVSFIPALQMVLNDQFDTELGEDEFEGLESFGHGLERLRNPLYFINSGQLAGSYVRARYCAGPQLSFFAVLQAPAAGPINEESARALLGKLGCPGD